MEKILKPDFCVIGAGAGGLSFAAGAAQMGASVVLLESQKMGGDCLNSGCVPSKALISAAKLGLPFAQAKKYVQEAIEAIAPHDSVERFEGLGVKVILETGHFTHPDQVQTKNHIIKAKKFIIATGSTPFIPPIPGLDKVPFETNETIFDLKSLPKHLAIIGGGPIGVELAQAFHRLGSKVTILEAFDILPKDDSDLRDRLRSLLIAEGITIHENIKIREVQKGIKIIHEQGKISASHVLVAAGRRPALGSLGLKHAGVDHTERGIIVNKKLQTSNSKIYAIGDCIGSYPFTHVAGYHAALALRNSIFHLGAKVDTRAIPWVTYTDPELAHVGEIGTGDEVLEVSFTENHRAIIEHRTEGIIKAHVTKKGEILGVSILGPHAGELIYPWVLAIQNNLTLSQITSSLAPYPTLSEISKTLAGKFYVPKIFNARMRWVVEFLMRWFA